MITKLVCVDEPIANCGFVPMALVGLTDNNPHGVVVPIPTLPDVCYTTSWSVPMARPPVEIVVVALVPPTVRLPSTDIFVPMVVAADTKSVGFLLERTCRAHPQPNQRNKKTPRNAEFFYSQGVQYVSGLTHKGYKCPQLHPRFG